MEESTEETTMVARMIEKATNSTRPEIDPRFFKAIKSAVRYSDSELRVAYQTLMSLMKRNHSQVRYLALLIIDELFIRSKLFRTLVVENLDQLLTLSVGFRCNLPLPAPAAVASLLRTKAIEFLEKWNISFGVHYRKLRLGYDYLKNTLRYQFPNLQANAARIQQERNERQKRTQEIFLKKFEKLKIKLPSMKTDIQSTIDEINECMEIMRNEDDNIPLATLDDEEIEEFRNYELRQIRLDSLKEAEKVHENSENKVIFDALRELYKVVVTKHLVAVQEWISILLRVDAEGDRFRDTSLKELIDILNELKSVKKTCEDVGCTISKTTTTEEEEDIWEDDTLEPLAKENSIRTENSSELCVASSSNKPKVDTAVGSNEGSNGKKKLICAPGSAEADPVRSKLLAEAPEVTWGTSLNYWGTNQDVLANQRGLELESHWGRVDYDVVIPAKKIAELSVQVTVYREDPVEIQPCRAPLKKGGLCLRRDLKVCPFHGPIIPRDDEGNPINPDSSSEKVPPDEEMPPALRHSHSSMVEPTPELVEWLARQALKNVRERDREEAKQNYDKRDLKRAKLAKVREHNEAVLRDAALSTTWRSEHIGEDSETTNVGRSGGCRRKSDDTLESMLKKKVTTRQRLAQKLLKY